MDLTELLMASVRENATDLHLTINSPPVLRIHGHLVPLEYRKLEGDDTRELLMSILSAKQKEVFEKKQAIDLAYSLNGSDTANRFRVNVFYQRGCVAGAFRRLADQIATLEELNLPSSLYNVCDIQDGLVLVTGPTGSGKTTTLATLIDRINETRPCHIMTIEDPVEYVLHHKKALINQRELYTDVPSFADGLRSALREDPDVIFVGEMRDLETMRTAIMAAETGHLVFATLHTRDATSTVGRIVGVFPTDEQEQIAHQLSLTLRSVVSQKLVRTKDGLGRVPAAEIMLVTPGISNMIRQHKAEQIRSVIETGATLGMQSMEHSFVRLYKQGRIDRETVLKNARDINYVERLLR
ncbi:MAG: type IV pili twitching motility protein PilT [Desulfobacterales bacterium S5133MH4]|nr:MAG: type IV pili twitching motility protein PilT [Desulfobacterales bacterium S5133MH4]